MKKTVCDICEKEIIETIDFLENVREHEFAISSYGRIWDICQNCRGDLLKWIQCKNT